MFYALIRLAGIIMIGIGIIFIIAGYKMIFMQ